MIEKTTVYLSLGSKLGNRYLHLQKCLFALGKDVGLIDRTYEVYENPSYGFAGEDFLNACIALETHLSPEEVLTNILAIEQQMGRKRKESKQYESRTIDIDILYYGDTIMSNEILTLPHPRIAERNFVLKPLADIAPQYYHPLLQKDSRNLLQETKDQSPLEKTRHTLFKDRSALFGQLQFLAIEGSIGAGKTTLSKKIAEDFNAKLVLERFADNPFLPKFYEEQSRYAFPLEMSFLADRYQQFTEDTSQFDLFKKFMVSDYDIFKSLIFAQITLQKDEFELYRKLFNFMYKEVKKPDIYVYLYQNTDRLLENIQKRGRAYEKNISASYLDRINRGYLDFIKSNLSKSSLIIDLEDLDFVHNVTDYEYVLDAIETKLLSSFF